MVAIFVSGTYFTACWLGLYFAVSSELFGHFNEVGGAGRVGKYQQLIRFKLTARDVTGYVIAIDDPQPHGKNLRPRIIDTFTVRP